MLYLIRVEGVGGSVARKDLETVETCFLAYLAKTLSKNAVTIRYGVQDGPKRLAFALFEYDGEIDSRTLSETLIEDLGAGAVTINKMASESDAHFFVKQALHP